MLELKYDKFPVLESERLCLRQMTMDDAGFLYELRTNELLNRFTDRSRLKTMEEAVGKMKVILDMVESKNGIAWMMELKENGKPIGDISFWRLIREHYRVEIGYSLHPDYWQQGYMTEAARCAIDYAFSILHVHSIEANVNPNNIASIRLLEKINFVREAYFRENYFYNGKFLDSAIYSLLNKQLP